MQKVAKKLPSNLWLPLVKKWRGKKRFVDDMVLSIMMKTMQRECKNHTLFETKVAKIDITSDPNG